MKGFTRDGKFHPIKNESTTRKKRLDYNDPELMANIGVKLNKTRHNEGIRLKRDHGIPQKRSGLNKVTIMEFTKKGKPYSPRLFQVNMNGKGAYFPSNKELSIEYAEGMIETAKRADKTGHKIGT